MVLDLQKANSLERWNTQKEKEEEEQVLLGDRMQRNKLWPDTIK